MLAESIGVTDNSFHVEKLLEITTRLKELVKENKLKDSRSESFELIRKLESQVKTLCQVQMEDKKIILQLEREMNNCSQEIDYLQDQVNEKNSKVELLQEHVCSFQLKLLDMKYLEEDVIRLQEELKNSKSEQSDLMQELENTYVELYSGRHCIEKLEESISSVELDYQCEIEGMKLNLMEMEQKYLEAKRSQEEATKENMRMKHLIQDLELQIQEKEEVDVCIHKKNRDLKSVNVFNRGVEEHLHRWIAEENQFSSITRDTSYECCAKIGGNVSELITLRTSNTKLEEKIGRMSQEIHEYQLLIEQLKEELKVERLKAKEEAEDLAQEMAELRYQLTGLLEAEYQRRACVERKSLQRISELEAELEKERCKSFHHQEQVRSATALRNVPVS